MNFVISGRPKGGTSQFETYATMQVVTEEQLPTMAVVRLTEDMSKIEFVRKLLSESRKLGLKKPLLLMDCELGSVDVMRFLDKHGERFLMAVSKRPGIKKAVSEFRRGKRRSIKIRDEIRRRNNIQVLAGDKKAPQVEEGQEKVGVPDVCHKCGTLVHKTHHEGCSRIIQKALANREQLQISRADPCQHRQPKSCDQSLYVLSLHDRVQPVVCGSAKDERGNRDQTWAVRQKKYGS